jgi:hypothetical protein
MKLRTRLANLERDMKLQKISQEVYTQQGMNFFSL